MKTIENPKKPVVRATKIVKPKTYRLSRVEIYIKPSIL